MFISISKTENIQVDELEVKNWVRTSEDTFECEINHPKYGWLDFTAFKYDVEPHGVSIWEALNEIEKNKETGQ
jgi:hypothetical protein